MPNEVILEVLAEGGSRVLYGLRQTDGWFFSLDYIDAVSPGLLMEAKNFPEKVVASISDALTLLDRYPWINLAPSMVHPEFRKEILNAVWAREAKSDATSRYHDRWVEKCAENEDENTKRYKVFKSITGSDNWMYDDLD